jgi:hypothetical protein
MEYDSERREIWPSGCQGQLLEIYRREGDTWKKRLDIWNVTPAPPPTAAATPSPTAAPDNK